MSFRFRTWGLAPIILVLAGCSITQTIEPIRPAHVSTVCILDNPKVHMDEFQPELQRLVEKKGVGTHIYEGNRPGRCSHYLEYTANWQWDMAMYLSYAELRVYDEHGLAGQAVYDARRGGGRMDKFGRTTTKLEPLVEELFSMVEVGARPNGASGSHRAPETGDSQGRAARIEELRDLHARGLISDEEFEARRQAIIDEI